MKNQTSLEVLEQNLRFAMSNWIYEKFKDEGIKPENPNLLQHTVHMGIEALNLLVNKTIILVNS